MFVKLYPQIFYNSRTKFRVASAPLAIPGNAPAFHLMQTVISFIHLLLNLNIINKVCVIVSSRQNWCAFTCAW